MAAPFHDFARILAHHAAESSETLAFREVLDDGAERRLTYGELSRRAEGVASRLIRMGVAEGERVMLVAPPGLDFVVGLFGCLRAGVVAVPTPPARTRRSGTRIQSIFVDANPAALVAPHVLRSRLEPGPAARARHDDALAGILALPFASIDEHEPVEALAVEDRTFGSDALALLQYTSGSTRTPRGVMLSHENLIRNCERLVDASGFTRDSRALTWLPPYHDLGLIGTLLAPVLVGAEVTILAPLAFLARPARWLRAIGTYGITHSGAPDFAYALCARRVSEAEKRDLDLSTWEVAFLGAERIREETLARFTDAFAPCGFRREVFAPGYGLAEATLGVTFALPAMPPRIAPVDESALGRGEIVPPDRPDRRVAFVSSGRPYDPEEVRIVHPASSTPLPEGRVGEIWVRGPCVARGYWNRPEESEATFGARIGGEDVPYLRTGDLGFFDDGELFVTGRIKDLLILAGENHHPEDLEATAERAHPTLDGATFAAISVESRGRERLVLVQEGADVADDVRAAVREAIARHHEVEVWEYVLVRKGVLPRTTSGKLQRGLLRELYRAGKLEIERPTTASEARDPELEARIATVVRDLLGVERVESDDDFFALGIHSLLATQLVVRLREALGREIPLRAIFESPSVVELAARLRDASPRPPRETPPEGAFPNRETSLTASQERMWFLHKLDPEGSAYNVAGAIAMQGSLDVDALERALRAVMNRHEILRARYVDGETGPLPRFDVALDPHLHVVSLENETDPFEACRRQTAAFARRPFDLARGPLVRAELFRRGPGDHVLAVCLHHIVADGGSMNVLLEELLEAYEAIARGRAPSLPALPHSFAEVAAEFRRTLESEATAMQIAYFRRRLAGAPELLALPTDRPRPPRMTHGGGVVRMVLPLEIGEAVKALGARHGATPFMVLLAAFELLLARITGQTDVIVGTPTAGRTLRNAERLVGTFVNMLPLRTNLDGASRFTDLLARVRATAIEAYEHQDVPFEKLVEALVPARAVDRTPIFQVMFDHQTIHAPDRPIAGLRITPERIDRGGVQLDLAFSVLDLGGRLEVTAEYREDLFDRATIAQLLASYGVLLTAALDAPDEDPFRYPLLDDESREKLLAIGRGEDRAYTYECAWLPIAEWAARTPEAIAVHSATAPALSYRELDQTSTAIARSLVERGVRRGDLVAVCLDRTPTLVAALLGIWKAGAAYVPLDAAYPRERLRTILEDARPSFLLYEPSVEAALPSIEHLPPRALLEELRRGRSTTTLPTLDGSDRAYVMFTSGSTGRPKGVEVTHRNVANMLASFARRLDVRPTERLFSVTTIAFDISALELFLPLVSGAEVEIASREVASNPEALRQRLEEDVFDWMQATPSTWTMLVDSGWTGSARLGVLCGGEALSEPLAAALVARTRVAFNVYGPTETTVWSTIHPLRMTPGPVSLGEPIDHTRLYVLDDRRELVPFGVEGELYIGGDGVARGYLDRPAWTHERFLPDPFHPGERMYRTGDAVRRLRSGALHFIGRRDDQVKLRGHRVELGDIEAALARHPDVRESAVALAELGRADHRLVAYVTVRHGSALEPRRLRAFVAEILPEFMVPSVVIFIETMPRTGNGKLDRRALPAPTLPALSSPNELPRTPTEAAVARAFERFVGASAVGLDDDFFALGGHSLLAVRVAAALSVETGVRLPLASLFAGPTVRKLAAEIERTRAELAEAALDLAPPRGVASPLVWVYAPPADALLPYRDRIAAIALDRGILAIPAPERVYSNVTSLAADAVAALRVRSHRGPHRLVGFGFGAVVAHEMGVQLAAMGDEVEAVVALDGVPRPELLPRSTSSRSDRDALPAELLAAWQRHRPEPFAGEALVVLPRALRRKRGVEGAWRKLLPRAELREATIDTKRGSDLLAMIEALWWTTARGPSRD